MQVASEPWLSSGCWTLACPSFFAIKPVRILGSLPASDMWSFYETLESVSEALEGYQIQYHSYCCRVGPRIDLPDIQQGVLGKHKIRLPVIGFLIQAFLHFPAAV